MRRCIILVGLLALTPLAQAGPVAYQFSSGNRAARVDFAKSGGDLIVTLTNTSTFDAEVPTDLLMAVFFEITGNPLLGRTSALVPLTSSVYVSNTGVDVTPADRVVGGEWGYLNSIADPPGHNQGISATGLGVFGPGDRFPGDNLQGPESLAGVQYGITSAGDDPLTGNGGLSGEHLVHNSVVFTLGGFVGEPSEIITAARFLYGTSLSEPQFEGELVPEPAGFVLAACGSLLALACCRGRRR